MRTLPFKASLFALLFCAGTAHSMDSAGAATLEIAGMLSAQVGASASAAKDDRLKLAILVSGTGSNMEAILSHIEDQGLKGIIEPRVIISNRRDARALKKAQLKEPVSFKKAIPTEYLPGYKVDQAGDYSRRLIDCLQRHNVTPENGLVCLAGFMKILDAVFVSQFKNRIINLHPSLLPAFKGGTAIKDALEYGVKITGCTVHFVDEGMDTGTIIMQRAVEVADDDTQDSLAEKIHAAEHEIYPRVVELFAKGRIRKKDRKVTAAETADGNVELTIPDMPEASSDSNG